MRTLRLAAMLAAAVLPAAGARPAVKNPDTYTYLSISEPDSMDPGWAYDTASHSVFVNVYETLFFFDGTSNERLLAHIAETVPSRANGLISPDAKTYTIPIRKGVKFHDGTPLTAEDVRYSLLRFMLQDRAAGPSALLLEPLVGYSSTRDAADRIKPGVWRDADRSISVVGSDIVLHLPRPYAPLLSILASWAPVVSRLWARKNGDWDGTEATWTKYNNPQKQSSPFFERMMGTGPFQLERWDRKTHELILRRYDGYRRGPARLKTVVIKDVKEFSTRKLMLQAGDADTIYADRPHLSSLQNLPGVEIIDDLPAMEMNPIIFFTFSIAAAGNPYLGSGRLDGNGIPPDFFADKDARKAFAYAFDYEGFLADVYRGKGAQATGVIPKSVPGHNPKGKTYRLDLKKAAEHFKKAWGGRVWEKGFRFTIAFNSGNVPRQTICQILKRNTESLNPKFRIDVRAVEWPTFLDAFNASKLPIFVMGWNADFPDPHNFAFPILHSQGNYPKIQRFKDPAFDRLIEQANAQTDPAQRKALYHTLQDMAFEKAPNLVVLDAVHYRTQRDWVLGWYHNPILGDSPYGSYCYPIHKQ